MDVETLCSKYKVIIMALKDAVFNINYIIKNSFNTLDNYIKNVYSRIGGELEFEYAGVGKMKFSERELLNNVDDVGTKKWHNYIGRKWRMTGLNILMQA